MKFFVDFEATQYTEEIIQIGCVCENGKTFNTYVRPAKDHKVGKFVKELTHITDEMLAEAPDADTAFMDFCLWVTENSNYEPAEYYCYGDSDTRFLTRTAKYMTKFMPHMFAMSMANSLKDYSAEVKQFFMAGPISLFHVFSLIEKDPAEQKHNALEDALMLKEVVNRLHNECSREDGEKIAKAKVEAKIKAKEVEPPKTYSGKKPVPEVVKKWLQGIGRWNADTQATEENYRVKATFTLEPTKVKYFDNVETAALWVIHFWAKGRSVKSPGHIQDTIKAIKNCPNYHGFTWEIVEKEEK